MYKKDFFEEVFKTELTEVSWSKNIKIPAYFTKKIEKTQFEEGIKRLKNFFLPKQVHRDEVLELDRFLEVFSVEADAVITRKSLFVGVRTADCVPILIATEDGSLIGAVHAGWKGSLKKILQKTIKKVKTFGYKPEEIFIAIGPHIRECCYEVKSDLIELLKKTFPDNYENFLHFRNRSTFLNLLKLNLFQVQSESIPLENVWILESCTCCNLEYASFRRDKSLEAFQLSFIGLMEKDPC